MTFIESAQDIMAGRRATSGEKLVVCFVKNDRFGTSAGRLGFAINSNAERGVECLITFINIVSISWCWCFTICAYFAEESG